MSIEEMITGLTSALRANAEATLKLADAMGTLNAVAKPEAPAAEKPKASKQTPAKTAEAPPPAASPITLEQVRAALMTLPDRKDVTNVLGRFGVSALSALPVEKYAECLEEVARLKDALQ